MRTTAAALAIGLALGLSMTASATTQARQFTQRIGVYERSIDRALEGAGWRTTGTKCEFRSGRTLVYCLTPNAKRKGTRERIETTMRRVSATRIRIRITFLNALNSGIPVLVKNAVQVSTVRGT
jgi:hypothetical protein